MFNRITYEEWTTVVPLIAFILTFGAFLVILWTTLRMKKDTQKHMAHLPLEQNETESSTPVKITF